MARTRASGAYKVGDLVGFKLSREDEADLIPFLNGRRSAGEEISSLLRTALRAYMRQVPPTAPQIDPEQLATWVGNLIRRAMTGEPGSLPALAPGAPAIPGPAPAESEPEPDRHAEAVSLMKSALGGKFADDDDEDL